MMSVQTLTNFLSTIIENSLKGYRDPSHDYRIEKIESRLEAIEIKIRKGLEEGNEKTPFTQFAAENCTLTYQRSF